MENLRRLTASHSTTCKVDTSERFDKQAVLQIHDSTRQRLATSVQTCLSSTDPVGSSAAASSVSLERLESISLTELQVGQVHHGRVLYGTLCAESFRMSAIMTVLEDNNGFAVKLAIYNAAHSQKNVEMLYRKGAKVAIREPYFNRADDGSLEIRVDNPANVEMLANQEEQAESLLDVNLEEMRQKGNGCFRDKQWDAAAEHYTKCIDAALLQLKKTTSNDNSTVNNCLLLAYSNRAKTRLQVNEFELALKDCDSALRIDSRNLNALYMKGRALFGLRKYKAACYYLEQAHKGRPSIIEIQDALCQAKTLYSQSRYGNYDISDYMLGRASSPPEVADFIGPVEIKMTKDGHGRGLYANREINTGQLLLVSNAVAVAYEDDDSAGINSAHRPNTTKENLVAAVISAARKSRRLLQQLYSLHDYSEPGNLDVPAIDLFSTEGKMSPSEAAGKEKLEVDNNRIREIIIRNSFGGVEQKFAAKSNIYEGRLVQRGKNFVGLWLLPSFINHSCLPNSSRLEVGSAMFIHASKPIKRGEEITISYFDTLVPLPQRQTMCESWGFKCNCRRCVLEFSLKANLEPITALFEEMHDNALEESNAARSAKRFDRYLPTCAAFASLFVDAEKIIRNSSFLKTEEERNWITASFVSAYLAGTQSNYFFLAKLMDYVPSKGQVMEAIQNTVPGDMRNLVMVAHQLKEAKGLIRDESEVSITQQAREACIGVFGRHPEDVLNELVLRHSQCDLF